MRSIKTILGNRNPITIDIAASVAEAAQLLTHHRIGAAPVVDAGRLVGMFSERDVLTRIVAAGLDPSRTLVRDVMTSDLIVADATESYETCLVRMQQAHIRHLPVLENGALIGVVSFRDLLTVDLSEKETTLSLLNSYVHGIPANLQKLIS